MSRSKRRKTSQPRRSDDPSIGQADESKYHLRSYFVVLDSAIQAGTATLSTAQGQISDGEVARLVLLDRAVTILQAGRLLLEDAHWETASGVARQMFELLVNVEHLAGQPDTEAALAKYKSFGVMALARRERRALAYATEQGFADGDGRGQELDKLLQCADFDQFRDKNGKLLDNWARRDVAAMAAMSPDALRKSQYEYYYRSWSEHAHASPSSLIAAIIAQPDDGAVDGIRESVYRETRQLIVMLISMFSDLVLVLGQPRLVNEIEIASWRDGLAAATEEWRGHLLSP